MKNIVQKIKNNVRLKQALKVVLCLFILVTIFRLQFSDGIKPYENYKDYTIINDNTGGEWFDLANSKSVKQSFTAAGNILNNVRVYYGNASDDREVEISIKDVNGKSIADLNVNTSTFIKNTWNEVGINTDKLSRSEQYTLCISSEGGLEGFIYGNGSAPEYFTTFSTDGSEIEGHLLMGVNQTYNYFNLAMFLGLIVTTIFSLAIGLALCISIIKFEDIYTAFNVPTKHGLSYALFFSVSIILLYNPIDEIRTKVISFKRIIGMGLNNDVDVSRRISNFNNWFIAFGVVFILLFMLANYYIDKVKTDEQKKVIYFLDNYMIVANCSLVLRCITYFKDSSATTTIYYFSQNIIMLLALVAIGYVVFSLDRYISIDIFEQQIISATGISVALVVFWGKELEKGRLLLGVATIIFIVMFITVKWWENIFKKEKATQVLTFITVMLALIPLATSLYIELIHVLNQHNVFVSHPAKYYKIACILGFLIAMIALYVITKGNYQIRNWKSIVFPITVAGITCLSIQIPLSSVYNLDLFESANSSILMSDYLNYGDIPIVQHYGGHMMTGVWEGILYAIVNNDFAGIVSPYSGLINVVLALLFYFVVAKIWDREMGLVISLLFPFLGFISYYGLGFLVCIAAMAYIRKNNMKRAILLWGSFVWCALYRLDLGFAFGIAVIIALLIYVIVEKNVNAFKELGLSLIGWGIIGGIAWFVICMVKGLNPINRLIEFLMINLSNQNWAYTGIGTVDNLVFAWGYIIVPFAMVLMLIYTVFSRTFRERVGTERWMLLLILNLSYFQNFSRGLVRHSLAENSTTIVFWCAYLYIAIFIAFYKESMKWFIPTFMLLIILNGLFLKPDNFTSTSIADSAVSAPETIIESWKPTRFYDEEDAIKADDGTEFKTQWEKIKYTQESVERIEYTDDLTNYAAEYEILLNELLENDETFVDFVNKTVLYSVLGYRCPVYVSQSPLQLSGEFTQKEFIKEIEGVPVVLMPVDDSNYRASNSLDGVTNAYRYYAVYEYIYNNYKPLCRYGNEYAVWCLPEKYKEYRDKVSKLISGKEYTQDLVAAEFVGKNNIELEEAEDSSVIARYTGVDPMITELQNLIDISGYYGQQMKIAIEYETDIPGVMQLYYTTDENEDYTAEKVEDSQIDGFGTAYFMVPVTKYTRLRLDTPEKSTVKIKALKAGSTIESIDYGYDGPVENIDDAGNTTYSYISALHNSSIAELPRIWAEADKENSVNNQIICSLTNEDGYYVFDNKSVPVSDNGNYLKISAVYDGVDTEGKYADDDESVGATVIFGYYKNGVFEQKYRYAITFDEGSHDYLIRCSTDYYWYLKEVNSIKVETTGNLRNVSMDLLEGD